MDSERLRTFLSIIETKNFSRTAETLFISQSSVSKRIHELEKEIGEALFLRKKNGVQLTNAGKSLKVYAEQIVNLEEKALNQIYRYRQCSEHLVLGVSYAYYDVHLSKQLPTFIKHNPHIFLTIKLDHSTNLLSKLLKASLDIVFTHHPLHYPEYVCKSIGQDKIALVTGNDNVEYMNGIPYKIIKELPMIDTNFLYAPTRQELFPLPYQPQIEIDIAGYALPLLNENGWYALLTRQQVENEIRLRTLREIPILEGEIPPVQHFVSYRREYESHEGLQTLLATL